MPRKILNFTIIIVLLVSTNGIFIDRCSCGNKAFAIYKTTNSEWCKCKLPCSHKVKYIKINDSYETCCKDRCVIVPHDFHPFLNTSTFDVSIAPLNSLGLLIKPPNLSLYFKDFFIEVFRL